MRRRSLSPPRTGATHSRYSPSWPRAVSPGCASAAAALIVRSGAPSEPSSLSEPALATWYTVIGLVPFLVVVVDWYTPRAVVATHRGAAAAHRRAWCWTGCGTGRAGSAPTGHRSDRSYGTPRSP